MSSIRAQIQSEFRNILILNLRLLFQLSLLFCVCLAANDVEGIRSYFGCSNIPSGQNTKCMFDNLFRFIKPEKCYPGYDNRREKKFLEDGEKCAKQGITNLYCFSACFFKQSLILEESPEHPDKKEKKFHTKKVKTDSDHKDNKKYSGSSPSNPTLEDEDNNENFDNLTLDQNDWLQLPESFNPDFNKGFSPVNARKPKANEFEKFPKFPKFRKIRSTMLFSDFDEFDQFDKIQGLEQSEERTPKIRKKLKSEKRKFGHDNITESSNDKGGLKIGKVQLNEKKLNEKLKLFFPHSEEDEWMIKKIRTGFSKCTRQFPESIPSDYFKDCSSIEGLLDCVVNLLMCHDL